MNFGSFLRGPKDAAIALGVRSFFNARYSRFGQMSDMSIDTARREIRLRLDLVGESTPVEIHLTNYSIQHQGERTQASYDRAKSLLLGAKDVGDRLEAAGKSEAENVSEIIADVTYLLRTLPDYPPE